LTNQNSQLSKTATGINGLDEVLSGGLPQGRTTLVCGSAGCGKTLLAAEFLIYGATRFDEPGVFMAFEETEQDLSENVSSLGFDLPALTRDKKLVVDYVHIERENIHETGEYDLEGLFIRLGHAIDSIGAKRVALDTIESLFSGLSNANILRTELRRLFRWLKDKGVTAVITGERGEGALTRHGLEEYISDCVILLDHRVIEQISTRRLRVVKYRGSTHGTNEYPFLIDEEGISVLPITSLILTHTASEERVTTGIEKLDDMMEGKGYFKGSSILVSGTAGTGKTSIAAHFCEAGCVRDKRVLYFAFEESPDQVLRNMSSIGIDLKPWINKGLLQFNAVHPLMHGMEMHLAAILKEVNRFKPDMIIVDPINSFITSDNDLEVRAMLTRMINYLKGKGITALFTSLTEAGNHLEHISTSVSSIIDTWLLLRNTEIDNDRRRGIYILKSRGMAHSSRVNEFLLTNHGVDLLTNDR
jgi:circadian clock protein KaiC